MSRIKRILCAVLLLAVVAVGGLAWWQRDNIGALITGLRYSQTELEDQLQQNDQAIKDAMDTVPDFSIRDLTEEDKQALKDGTMTREELIESLIEPVQKPEDKPATSPEIQPEKTDKPDSSVQQPEEDPVQQQVAAVIAEAYVLREEFLAKLDDLLAQAMAEYKAIPAEERASKVPGMVSRYLSTGWNCCWKRPAAIPPSPRRCMIPTQMKKALKKPGIWLN